MTPVLITPPAGDLVSLPELKAHLRVDHAEEDGLIQTLGLAAMGYLDGWAGVLGRAIQPQTWRVTAERAGEVILPLPDVSAAVADYGAGPEALVVVSGNLGAVVTVTGPCSIDFICGMAAQQQAIAAVIVKMLVGHWYENREAVNIGNITSQLPMAAEMLITALRGRRL